MNPLLIEIQSDVVRDNWIDYLPIEFPFAIYTPPTPPSPKRQRVSSPPLPYFDPNIPTFGQPTPPLMDGSTASTVASTISFSIENISPDTVGTVTSPIFGVTPLPSTRILNPYVGATPTLSTIRTMV